MTDKYILNNKGEAVPEPDLITWARWFEDSWPTRSVAHEEVGGYTVSTVFLALDHQFGDGPPLLWETMVFKGKLTDAKLTEGEIEMDRCSGNREQAEAMHATMMKYMKTKLKLTKESK